MVNKERMKLWIEDLESTEELQGKHWLVNTYYDSGIKEYCCLGRACVVAQKNGLKIKETPDSFLEGVFNKEYSHDLPLSVRLWYGLNNRNPAVARNSAFLAKSGVLLATEANDRWALSFKQIAAGLRDLYNIPKDN